MERSPYQEVVPGGHQGHVQEDQVGNSALGPCIAARGTAVVGTVDQIARAVVKSQDHVVTHPGKELHDKDLEVDE